MAEIKLASERLRKIAQGYEVDIYGIVGATDDNIVEDVLIADGALTVKTPQHSGGATAAVFTITDADISITALDVDIVGTKENGDTATETVSLDNSGAGGTITVASTNRWLRFDSITLKNAAGNGAGDNVKVGTALSANDTYSTALSGAFAGDTLPAEDDWIVRGVENQLVYSVTSNQAGATSGLKVIESDDGDDTTATLDVNIGADTPKTGTVDLTARLYRFEFTMGSSKAIDLDLSVRVRRKMA